MTEAVFPHLHKYGGGWRGRHSYESASAAVAVRYLRGTNNVGVACCLSYKSWSPVASRRSVRSFGAFASLHVGGGGAVGGYGQGRKGGSGQLQQGFLDLILNRELDGRENQEALT